MRIKKAIIVGLMLPLVSEICAMPAGAVSYVGTPTSRPSTTARMPTLLTSGVTTTTSSASTNAGLLATCANPLPDRLTADRCISRYDNCLHNENVCGTNFELCYNLKQFNKSRIMCQEVLAQCPAEAIKALFGTSVTTSNDLLSANRTMCDGESVLTKRTFSPALGDISVVSGSRVDLAIKDGKSWAAANSVKSCTQTADKCIRTACINSPQKCIANNIDLSESDIIAMQAVAIANGGEASDVSTVAKSAGATDIRLDSDILNSWITNLGWDEANAKNYLKQQCLETIGTNEWCYRVTYAGKVPSDADLADLYNIEDIYDDIMNGINGRWRMNQSKIREWVATAALESVSQCKTVATNCIKNACGEGSLARCYGMSKEDEKVNIKSEKLTESITSQCKDIIENNQYCKDVFSGSTKGSVWSQVWTQDLTNAVADLNALLQTSYNEQAVAVLRKNCQAKAEQCVTDECGADFSRCFITSSDAKKSGSISFSGGVATTTNLYSGGFNEVLARDLCLLKAKTYDDCNNYFDVQYAKSSSGKSADAWAASSSARDAWLGVTSQSSSSLCKASGSAESDECKAQEREIFDGLLADISKRANSVLEREANDLKNECEAKNAKGSLQRDYVWAALDDSEPNAEFSGYKSVTETSDPFNGFCAVRVVTQSNNSEINKILTGQTGRFGSIGVNNSNLQPYVYYPMGSSGVICSGIDDYTLEKIYQGISESVDLCDKGQTPETDGCVEKLTGFQKTMRIAGASVGGAVGGGLLGTLAANAIKNTGNKNNRISSADETLYAECQKCIGGNGAGYSSLSACKTGSAGETGENEAALAKCKSKAQEIEKKTGNDKTGLLDLSSKGSKVGGIAGAAIGGIAAGYSVGESISAKEAAALKEAREKFYEQTDINCYIGGKKVAEYGKDMEIK